MLGIGAAIKLFPFVVVPVLVAIRWREGRRDEARRLVVSAALTFLAFNVPIAARTPPLVVDLRVPVAPASDVGQRLVLPPA